jgi:hypothetical protein
MMEEQKSITANVADLENRGTVCKKGDSGAWGTLILTYLTTVTRTLRRHINE